MTKEGALPVLLVLVAFIPLAAQDTARNQPVFKARADAVNVDVLVTKDGAPLRGLSAGNFEVNDNGVVQVIESVSTEPVQLDVTVVLGFAARVNRDQLPSLASAGEALREALTAQDHVSIVPFTSSIRGSEFTGGEAIDLRQWLDKIPSQRGLQPMRDALSVAMIRRHDHPGRFLVVVLGDGFDGRSWATREQVVEEARRSDVVVYALKSTASMYRAYVNAGFLDDVVGETGGRVMSAEQGQLREPLRRLLAEYRSRYVLSYQPSAPSPGWHTLSVSLKGTNGRVLARRGYWVE